MSVGAAEGFHSFQLSKRNLFIENFLSQKSAQKKKSPGPVRSVPGNSGPQMFEGKTLEVFMVFHSIANVFPRIMALLIGNISLQACYTLKVFPANGNFIP